MTLATSRRKRIGLRTRFAVLQAGGFRCHYCGRGPVDGAILEVDHRLPVVAGGTNDRNNLVVSCQSCNNGKGGTPLAACGGDDHVGPFELWWLVGDQALICRACRAPTTLLTIDGRWMPWREFAAQRN